MGEKDRPPGLVGDHADKLGRVPGLRHDDEERPSGEDRDYGHTLFTRGVRPFTKPLRELFRRPPKR
jgi:hypothetical protein